MPTSGLPALVLAAAAARADRRRVDLVEDLHQRAGGRHDDEVAVDDVAELMGDDGALLVLVQELEDAVGDDDARVRAQQAVGEGGGVAIGDKSQARDTEHVLVRNLVHEGMHPRKAPLDIGVVEKCQLVEPAQRPVAYPRADEPDDAVDDDGQRDGKAEIDVVGEDQRRQDHAADHAQEQADGDERGKEKPCHRIPPCNLQRRKPLGARTPQGQQTGANLGLLSRFA